MEDEDARRAAYGGMRNDPARRPEEPRDPAFAVEAPDTDACPDGCSSARERDLGLAAGWFLVAAMGAALAFAFAVHAGWVR